MRGVTGNRDAPGADRSVNRGPGCLSPIGRLRAPVSGPRHAGQGAQHGPCRPPQRAPRSLRHRVFLIPVVAVPPLPQPRPVSRPCRDRTPMRSCRARLPCERPTAARCRRPSPCCLPIAPETATTRSGDDGRGLPPRLARRPSRVPRPPEPAPQRPSRPHTAVATAPPSTRGVPPGPRRRCRGCTSAARCSSGRGKPSSARRTTLVQLHDPLYDDLVSKATLAIIEGRDPDSANPRVPRGSRAGVSAVSRVRCSTRRRDRPSAGRQASAPQLRTIRPRGASAVRQWGRSARAATAGAGGPDGHCRHSPATRTRIPHGGRVDRQRPARGRRRRRRRRRDHLDHRGAPGSSPKPTSSPASSAPSPTASGLTALGSTSLRLAVQRAYVAISHRPDRLVELERHGPCRPDRARRTGPGPRHVARKFRLTTATSSSSGVRGRLTRSSHDGQTTNGSRSVAVVAERPDEPAGAAHLDVERRQLEAGVGERVFRR